MGVALDEHPSVSAVVACSLRWSNVYVCPTVMYCSVVIIANSQPLTMTLNATCMLMCAHCRCLT